MRALQRAYDRAGFPISTVQLIEGHGTGTPLGDRVEITAIQRLIDEHKGNNTTWLGSIKSNIGHCKAAASSAGLIKAIMALKRKVLPPTVNCVNPNPVFGKPIGSLRPITEGTVWTSGVTPRRASVSSKGFGGANSHITLEEANPDEQPVLDDLALLGSDQPDELILISAENVLNLKKQVDNLTTIANRICRAELTDLSAALAKTPTNGNIRLAIIADSPWQLSVSLKAVSENLDKGIESDALDDPMGGIFAGRPKANPSFLALFPGQGSQLLNMGKHLLRRFPFIRELYEKADKALLDIIPGGLSSYILRDIYDGNESNIKSWEMELKDTRIAQPALVLTSIASLKILNFYGLKPAIAVGHSLGEISALYAAGALDDVAAVRVAALRGKAMGVTQP